MPLSPAQALQQLTIQTSSFLESYPVRIFGDPIQSHVANYRIEDGGASQRPGSVLKTKNMHATQSFLIKAQGAAAVDNPPNAVWFQAHSVKMFQSNNPNAIGTYDLPLVGGPHLMVTGQLSGCSFAIHDNGDGSLVVAHIQPSQQLDGTTLHQTLKKTSYWDVVYGRDDYDMNRRASIVGSRSGGQWHIWAKKQDGTTGDFRVRKVKKLI